jgi:hypothetical protein
MGPSRQKDRDAPATTRARQVRAVARARHRTAAEAGRWRMETERWSWPRQAARPHPALRQLLARDYWGITSETAPHRLLVPATVSVPLVLKICDSRIGRQRGPRPSPEVIRAWHLLTGSGGAIPIGNVAADVGWSHKHLIAKFTEQVGLRPKNDGEAGTVSRTPPPVGAISASTSDRTAGDNLLREARGPTGRRRPEGRSCRRRGAAGRARTPRGHR